MEENYLHKIEYYETDKMGIVHHSNYIRWMESARIDFLDKIGLPYVLMEDIGVMSPVLSVKCDYKSALKFGDSVRVEIDIAKYTGLKLVVNYKMYNVKSGKLCADGESMHCFTDSSMKFVNLRKAFPEIDNVLKENM